MEAHRKEEGQMTRNSSYVGPRVCAFLLFGPSAACAQAICTADMTNPPPKLETELGVRGASDLNMASQFAHEAGHGNYFPRQNDLEHYGEWWTQNYGKTALSSIPTSGDANFWSKISLLADRAAQGVHALQEVWPQSPTSLRRVQGGGSISLLGDIAPFSSGISVRSSEIRMGAEDAGGVTLASLKFSGVCIGLNEVMARYPGAIATGFPHADAPEATATWTAYGEWGGLWFGFANARPKCLASVAFHPGEAYKPSEPYYYPAE
jgi:hypothetical protein